METKDDFIICPNKETDNAQMARLIRCVIDEFGVSRKVWCMMTMVGKLCIFIQPVGCT